MKEGKNQSGRNLSMECAKMAAAVFVVFIHAQFPGAVGSITIAFARFAVPMFFAISGYFNYRADSPRILRRMVHIVKLNVGAIVLYVLWMCFTAAPESLGAAVSLAAPDAAALVRWMLLHASPYALAEPMWFLTALAVTYGLFCLYTGFFGSREVRYQPLYAAGFALFAIYFTLAAVLPSAGMDVPYKAYRNGWLLGVPMFAMGLFIREFQQQLIESFRLTRGKLAALMALGSLLVLLQWKAEAMTEITVGTLLSVTALMLLMAQYPVTFRNGAIGRAVSRLGAVSTAVYILHPVLVDVYDRYIQPLSATALGAAEPWVRPIAVLGLSLAAAAVWEGLGRLAKRK